MFAFSLNANSASIFLLSLPLSLIDIRHYRIPDTLLSITSLVSILLACIFDRAGLLNRFLLCGGTFFFLALFQMCFKSGLGFGDVKFISIAAFNLGLFDTWVMLFSACVFGIVFGLARKALRKEARSKKKRMPFVPFLCLGIFVSLFANPPWL